MKKLKKSFLGILLGGFLITQTGCIAGPTIGLGMAATGNPYAAAGGVVVGILGVVYGGLLEFAGEVANDKSMQTLGYALDEKNPGRLDALNAIPMDASVAQKIDASLDSIATYNDELPQVIVTNDRIEKLIQKTFKDGLSADQREQMARSFGFSDANELASSLSSKTFNPLALQKFAASQGMSPESAKIYLKLRFGIQEEI